MYKGEDRKLLQFHGKAPIEASRIIKESLRCNFCQYEIVAKGNIEKWTSSARSSAVLQKCSGVPFYRLSNMQSAYGVPISDSKLWILCKELWDDVGIHVYDGLLDEMSMSKNLYTDDTTAKILDVTINNNRKLLAGDKKDASCYSTVLSSETAVGKIVLYLTKQSYCGNNIASIVAGGNKNIMSDASSMNIPNIDKEALSSIKTFYCLAHAYRKFKDILEYYPKECGYFIKEVQNIYKNDEEAINMTESQRLNHHKNNSDIHIQNIYQKIDELFTNKIVEPSSHLGKAMQYWLNHREGLTRFLTDGGVDLDNNRSERYLKRVILQRKNSLFFKTLSSAEVLSGLTSIIETCIENKISSYDYLNWLQDNRDVVPLSPKSYLPSEYKEYINETERIAI